MHLSGLDWTIVAAVAITLVIAAIACNRFARTVSGFLAAERCAGRYLIAVSYGMAQLGVISLVWFWQQYYDVGFTSIWWGFMEGPALIIIALSGWVVYRFRETRAMTMAQFFEVRYSRKFRVFAGFVAFIAGIINYGIFPAVAARFFIALCGFPETMMLAGFELSTFSVIMFGLLSVALFFVFLGGQVAVIVTDFIQGSFGQFVFLVVMVFLLSSFSWGQIETALFTAPEGKSMVNPFDLGEETRFNAFYWVISVIVLFYGMLGWQGTSGYNAAALNPHEAKMANILNGWRFRVLLLITLVLPICIKVVMTSPEYAAEAAQVQSIIEMQAVRGADPAVVAAEIRTPAAASVMLPSGLLGLFAAALLGAFISTNDTYLHSWGSIFIQDVVLPIRGKPLSPRAHIWLLRGSIFGVAIFAFVFSLYYTPNQYVSMFLALTGAIFVGGAGSAIIGGLYWRRGTTAGAWVAMVVGMSLAVFGVIVKQLPEHLVHPGTSLELRGDSIDEGSSIIALKGQEEPVEVQGSPVAFEILDLSAADGASASAAVIKLSSEGDEDAIVDLSAGGPEVFVPGHELAIRLHPETSGLFAPLVNLAWYVRTEMTGQVLTFWSIAMSVSLYIVVSLLTCRSPFNLERMLHRGKWSHDGEGNDEEEASAPSWLERLGFDRNMTRWDRIVTAVTLAWPMFFTIVFFAGLLHHFLPGASPFTDEQWVAGWRIWLWFAIGIAMIVSCWFTVGGIRDLIRMFRRLESVRTDARDDGSVIAGINADDLESGDGREA